MASDPALLLAAAVKAACHLKAPRRTIVAGAAAVAAALMQPVTVATSKATGPGVASGSQDVDPDSCLQPAQQLREARAAKRQLRRQRKRATAAATVCKNKDGSSGQTNPARGTGMVDVATVEANKARVRKKKGTNQEKERHELGKPKTRDRKTHASQEKGCQSGKPKGTSQEKDRESGKTQGTSQEMPASQEKDHESGKKTEHQSGNTYESGEKQVRTTAKALREVKKRQLTEGNQVHTYVKTTSFSPSDE